MDEVTAENHTDERSVNGGEGEEISGLATFDTHTIEEDLVDSQTAKVKPEHSRSEVIKTKLKLLRRRGDEEDEQTDNDRFHLRRYRPHRPNFWVIIFQAITLSFVGMAVGYHLMAASGELYGVMMQYKLKSYTKEQTFNTVLDWLMHSLEEDRLGRVLRNASVLDRNETTKNCVVMHESTWTEWRQVERIGCGIEKVEHTRSLFILLPAEFDQTVQIKCPATHEVAYRLVLCRSSGFCGNNQTEPCILMNEDSCYTIDRCIAGMTNVSIQRHMQETKNLYDQQPNDVFE